MVQLAPAFVVAYYLGRWQLSTIFLLEDLFIYLKVEEQISVYLYISSSFMC